MRNRTLRLGAVLTLLAGLLVAGVVGATAASAATCTAAGHYFDGWESNSTTAIYGVSANLTYETPTLCTGNNGTSNYGVAWSMVANVGAGSGWAQSGELYSPGWNTCLEHFAQALQGTSYTPETVVYGHPSSHCAANGQVHQVWTDFNTTDQVFFMNIDSTTILISPFDPAAVWGDWGTTNIRFEVSGEVGSLSSNMPGNAARPSNFANVSYQYTNLSDTDFADVCGLVTFAGVNPNNPSHWGQANPSCDNFQIYTSVAQ